MCTLSMVHDHYDQRIPSWPNMIPPWTPSLAQQSVIDLAELRKLIDDFRAAVEAAKTVDRLTGQPDCLDPEKAKLQERVDRLEKIIDALLKARA